MDALQWIWIPTPCACGRENVFTNAALQQRRHWESTCGISCGGHDGKYFAERNESAISVRETDTVLFS